MKRLVIVVTLLTLLALTSTSQAVWTQRFQTDAAAVDHVQMMIVSPATFAPVAISNFSVGGWSQTFNDGTLAIADGTRRVGSLQFDITFDTAKATPFVFHFQSWDGTNINAADDAFCRWTGSAWQFSGGTWEHVRLVPEPATVAMLGLGGLALLRKRKKS